MRIPTLSFVVPAAFVALSGVGVAFAQTAAPAATAVPTTTVDAAATATASAARTVEMRVDGLVCAFCAQGISKKLGAMPATGEVLVNLERGVVAVALKPGQELDDAALRTALTEAGYTVKSIARTSEPLPVLRARLAQKS